MKTISDFLLAIRAESINDARLTLGQRIKMEMEFDQLLSIYKNKHVKVKTDKLQTVREATEYFIALQAQLQKTTEQESSSTTPLRSTVTQDHAAESSSSKSSLTESPRRALRPQDPYDPIHIPHLDLSDTSSNKAQDFRNNVPRVPKIDSEIGTPDDAAKLLVKRALKKLKKRDKNKPRFKPRKSSLPISATPSTKNNKDKSISLSSSSKGGAVLVRKSRFTILSPEELQAIRNPELSSTPLSSSSSTQKGVVIAGKLPTMPSPSSNKKGLDR